MMIYNVCSKVGVRYEGEDYILLISDYREDMIKMKNGLVFRVEEGACAYPCGKPYNTVCNGDLGCFTPLTEGEYVVNYFSKGDVFFSICSIYRRHKGINESIDREKEQ